MKLAKEFDTKLLCQVPLVMEVGEAAEEGRNVFQQENMAAVEAFETLAGQVMDRLKV